MLVNIYGSKEVFVNEYRTLLADRILTHYNYDTARELRYLELLKLRFGETQLHSCEVMLKDVADSKRLNTRVAEQCEQEREKEGGQEEEVSEWEISCDKYWLHDKNSAFSRHPAFEFPSVQPSNLCRSTATVFLFTFSHSLGLSSFFTSTSHYCPTIKPVQERCHRILVYILSFLRSFFTSTSHYCPTIKPVQERCHRILVYILSFLTATVFLFTFSHSFFTSTSHYCPTIKPVQEHCHRILVYILSFLRSIFTSTSHYCPTIKPVQERCHRILVYILSFLRSIFTSTSHYCPTIKPVQEHCHRILA